MDQNVTAQLQALLDRQAITDVLYRYARGLDRMDKPLALSCYHPDATDDHAPLYKGDAAGFIDWVWPVHDAAIAFRHVISNITVALDGDRAGSECYWTLTMRLDRGGQIVDMIAGGRYLDRMEKIDGVWAIRHRQSVRDWSRADPVATIDGGSHLQPLIVPNNPEAIETKSRRDRDDYSYLVLEPIR